MNPSPSVSVVITTYNRSDALVAVLDALTRQTDSNFDVVVADDGSTIAPPPKRCTRRMFGTPMSASPPRACATGA
jgi:hypothetical protein